MWHPIEVTIVHLLQNLLELVSNEMANDNCQKDEGLVAFYNATLSPHLLAEGPARQGSLV